MTRKKSLQIIFIIAIAGLLFSGYLSYGELFGTCDLGCPAPGAPGSIFGYPACVYGFFMYLLLVIFSGLGLRAKK
ncbi:MAG: hypothetical protein ABII02_02485 [Candidatus Magasanikbacteria bacterium]